MFYLVKVKLNQGFGPQLEGIVEFDIPTPIKIAITTLYGPARYQHYSHYQEYYQSQRGNVISQIIVGQQFGLFLLLIF